MIRINLLPRKKTLRRREGSEGMALASSGQGWLALVLGAVVLEVVALLFVYKTKEDELKAVQKHNQELTSNIDAIKRETANHADIKAQLKELRDREEAIQKLQSARTGPTSTMLELSHMLTPGRGPTVEAGKLEKLAKESPGMMPNTGWDPRRLWVVSYREQDRGVRLTGLARDGEDVSEFLRRLSISDYFYEPKLLPAQKTVDSVTKLELVKFEMSAKVKY